MASGFSTNKSSPVLKRVAFVALKDTRQDSDQISRLERYFQTSLQKLSGFSSVPEVQVDHALDEVLSGLMKEEMDLAQSHYYQFHFSQAEEFLLGRMDEEALKMRALIAFLEGHQERSRVFLEKLLKNFQKVEFSSRDYPPHFLTLFKEVSKKTTKDSGRILKVGGSYFLNEEEIQSWKGRFQKLLHRMDWDYLILYRMEKIGWNDKITIYLFSQNPQEKIKVKSAEIIDSEDLSKAANILMKTAFSVDTLRSIK